MQLQPFHLSSGNLIADRRFEWARDCQAKGDLAGAAAEAKRMHQSGLELGDIQASGGCLDVWVRASGGQVPAELVQVELQRPREDVQGSAMVMLAEGVRLFIHDRLEQAAADSYMGATDLADFLVMKGVPFRTAHEIVARAVREALDQKRQLSEIDLTAFSPFFSELPAGYLAPENIVGRKNHSSVVRNV